jgi:TolA-binding protein
MDLINLATPLLVLVTLVVAVLALRDVRKNASLAEERMTYLHEEQERLSFFREQHRRLEGELERERQECSRMQKEQERAHEQRLEALQRQSVRNRKLRGKPRCNCASGWTTTSRSSTKTGGAIFVE